jgi:hypothetical protein
VAWVITDQLCENAVARLLGRRPWANSGKAKTLPDARAKRPIGVFDAMQFPNLALVEGGPDLLAAFHFMLLCGTEKDVAPICMTTANAEFSPGDLQRLRGKSIRLFPHADEKGYQAAHRWFEQLNTVTREIDIMDFRGLIKPGGDAVKDLNDLVFLSGAESVQDQIGRVMVFERRQHGFAQRVG